MSIRTGGLLFGIALLVILHFAYSSEMRRDILGGAYFTTGSTVMSNGENFNVLVRLQSHDNQVHDFEQINSYSQKFSFSMVNSLFGSARFLTNPTGDSDLLRSFSVRDRDLAFNYAYLSSHFSKLTFYKLTFDNEATCFYLKELEKVLCLGVERSRTNPPL